ncbi:MAG: hypothetical protein GY884_04705 [Proteobacteria bacterium]|nr:hypothetical protein [Pseudomonadota bacterium]
MPGLFELFLISAMSGSCGGSSSSSSSSTGTFSCEDYQIMMDVEVELATTCSTDSQCTQVLYGSGCGCSTDDVVANGSFDTTYLYDLWDEADDATCSVEFDTSCDCDASAQPVCVSGNCTWR